MIFQDLVRDLRVWIYASMDPVSQEAKMKYIMRLGSGDADYRIAEEVENIKTMEGNQEYVFTPDSSVMADCSCVRGLWIA